MYMCRMRRDGRWHVVKGELKLGCDGPCGDDKQAKRLGADASYGGEGQVEPWRRGTRGVRAESWTVHMVRD